jgi:hypothetical protein
MKILKRKWIGVAITLFVLPLLVNSYIARTLVGAAITTLRWYPDYNGDGYSDLAVGVLGENIGTIVDAGAVNVIFSSGTGLNAYTVADRFLNQDTVGLDDQCENYDEFGSCLTGGDFNKDGYADLVVGIPHEDFAGQIDVGAIQVVYGASNGFSKGYLFTKDSPNVEGVCTVGDHFGYALAVGDFNGDGYHDLAIGVPYANVAPARMDAGAVNVIYGSPGGLSATWVPDQIWNQNSLRYGDGSESADCFGSSLAAGDFNKDGYADLAIGVPYEIINTVVNAGAVDVIYGSKTGLNATVKPDQFWYQGSSAMGGVSQLGDLFGEALATGDFNGDGYADLTIGACGKRINNNLAAGAIYTIYGSATGLQRVGAMYYQGALFGAIKDMAERDDRFGDTLATGDFNVDGYDDLAVGIPYEDVGTIVNAGAVHVFYGNTGGLQAVNPDDQIWTQNSANVEDVCEANDYFGDTLTVGYFNRASDKAADLAIGVPGEDIFYGMTAILRTDAGAVNVIYSSPTGLSATYVPDQFWTQDSAYVEDTSESYDFFGGQRH